MSKISADKIVSFGFGNMAKAILCGWEGFTAIVANARSDSKINYLAINDELFEAKLPSEIELLLLAIKPYQLEEAAQNLKKLNFAKNAVVISVLAGVTTDILQKYFPNHVNIVRVMPNTPIAVGCGVSGIYLPKNSSDFKDILDELFASKKNRAIYVEREDDLNKITALSGSGAAYFFALIGIIANVTEFNQEQACQAIINNCEIKECLNLTQYDGSLLDIIEKHCQSVDGLYGLVSSFIYLIFLNALEFGFSKDEAKILSQDLAFGSANYVLTELKNSKNANQLKKEVTSKNGTTARALEVLESKDSSNLTTIINLAIKAAYLRAVEIGKSTN